MKFRQKNWRESRSRETEVDEKIAVTSKYVYITEKYREFCAYLVFMFSTKMRYSKLYIHNVVYITIGSL